MLGWCAKCTVLGNLRRKAIAFTILICQKLELLHSDLRMIRHDVISCTIDQKNQLKAVTANAQHFLEVIDKGVDSLCGNIPRNCGHHQAAQSAAKVDQGVEPNSVYAADQNASS